MGTHWLLKMNAMARVRCKFKVKNFGKKIV